MTQIFNTDDYVMTVGDENDKLVAKLDGSDSIAFNLIYVDEDLLTPSEKASFIWTAIVAVAPSESYLRQVRGVLTAALNKYKIKIEYFDDDYEFINNEVDYNGYIKYSEELNQFVSEVLRSKPTLIEFLFGESSSVQMVPQLD